jgi:hypothetical protein
VGITDDYRKQEWLVLTPTLISLKQKYFSDIPYQDIRRNIPLASYWSLLRGFFWQLRCPV